MNDRDAKILMEKYSLVRENESQQAAPSIPPEAQQKAENALKQIIDSLSDEQKQNLLKLLEGGKDIETALKEIQGQSGQQIAAESYLEEGLGRRLLSRGSGALNAIKGKSTPGDKNTGNYQIEKINKRFQILTGAIGKHLKELQRDLATTKNANPKITDQVNQMIQKLGTSQMGGIKPVESKFQDIRHGIGRGVQAVGTAAAIATPLAILTAPLATSLGTAAATKAGVGALTSVAMDLIKGQRPKWKKALAGAVIGGAVGAGMYGLQNAGGAGDVPQFRANPGLAPDAGQADNWNPDYDQLAGTNQQFQYDPSQYVNNVNANASTPQIDKNTLMDIIKHWKGGTKTQFGHMDMSGTPSADSSIDNTMALRVYNAAKAQGLDWNSMSDKAKNIFVSKITGPHGRG
jgi:hypothetical protein